MARLPSEEGVIRNVLHHASRPHKAGAWILAATILGSSLYYIDATNLLTLLLYAGLNGVLYFLSFNLQQVQGYSPVAAGAALFPFTVLVFVLSRWTGGLVQRYGARLLLISGSVITALGFALFAVPDIGGSYWITYFPAIIVMSLGMAIVVAPLTTAVMSSVEQRHSGVASGVNNAVARAAGLLAIAVLGLLVTFVFNSVLTNHTALLHLSPAVQQALDAQRSRLAAAQAPSTSSPTVHTALQRAIAESFVAGFRVTMLVSAGLALLGALVVALLVPLDHAWIPYSRRSQRRRQGPSCSHSPDCWTRFPSANWKCSAWWRKEHRIRRLPTRWCSRSRPSNATYTTFSANWDQATAPRPSCTPEPSACSPTSGA